MRILVVDDDPQILKLLEKVIGNLGHHATLANNGREAIALLKNGSYQMVISDWEMPETDGLELCRHIRDRYFGKYIYIILLTVRSGAQNIIDGLNAGADEFLSKPFDVQELAVRIRTGERILSLDSRDITIFALAQLAESRDQETGAHVDRLREYCQVIAEHLSRLEKHADVIDHHFIDLIYSTSPLHDIGKVGIPDEILLKSGPLTPSEFDVMKQHPLTGSVTIDFAISQYPEAKFLCMARDIARSHHERYDGTGYPDGLAGNAIPLAGRIVALADVYDALTTNHVYRPAYSHARSREIIIEGRGTQFDPDVVDAFLANEDRFLEIHKRFSAREAREERLLRPLADESLVC